MKDEKKENVKNENKKEVEDIKEATAADILSLLKDFFKLQNQYNHFRIEEYKEWKDKECECPICVDYTVHLCDEKEPVFCDGFMEEWE